MNNYSINIAELYKNAFGYVPIPYDIDFEGEKQKYSSLGTELYSDTEFGEQFLPVKLTDNDDNREFILPYSTVSLVVRNEIVSTQLVGRNGNVHEYINENDLGIRIRGIYVSETEFPERGLKELNQLKKRKKAIEIVNAVTDIFLENRQKIILRRLRIPAMQGQSYAQAYEIDAVSDLNLELEIE